MRSNLLFSIYMPHLRRNPFFFLWSKIDRGAFDDLCVKSIDIVGHTVNVIFHSRHHAEKDSPVYHLISVTEDLSFEIKFEFKVQTRVIIWAFIRD